ncbi:MAG: hypothetical protein ACI901_001139 [Octadecabacter sp.]
MSESKLILLRNVKYENFTYSLSGNGIEKSNS